MAKPTLMALNGKGINLLNKISGVRQAFELLTNAPYAVLQLVAY
jgi:hypothetical protein